MSVRRAPPWPADREWTESRLASIARQLPAETDFLAAVADALDPKGARARRDERIELAVLEACGLLRQPSRNATALEVEAAIRRFLSDVWPRQRELTEPAPGSSPLRAALWRLYVLTGGQALTWRPSSRRAKSSEFEVGPVAFLNSASRRSRREV